MIAKQDQSAGQPDYWRIAIPLLIESRRLSRATSSADEIGVCLDNITGAAEGEMVNAVLSMAGIPEDNTREFLALYGDQISEQEPPFDLTINGDEFFNRDWLHDHWHENVLQGNETIGEFLQWLDAERRAL